MKKPPPKRPIYFEQIPVSAVQKVTAATTPLPAPRKPPVRRAARAK